MSSVDAVYFYLTKTTVGCVGFDGFTKDRFVGKSQDSPQIEECA